MYLSPQLCLLAKCFKPALPYLDVDMVDICKENGAYDAKHFLCYYYSGGMVYTGLKNFERALYFYEQVVTPPAWGVYVIREACLDWWPGPKAGRDSNSLWCGLSPVCLWMFVASSVCEEAVSPVVFVVFSCPEMRCEVGLSFFAFFLVHAVWLIVS